ncbi:MAG: transcriptional repressor [Saprospiraceae bacterium]|nr:transcriptional repressor [Saprospiraceae bacterium]
MGVKRKTKSVKKLLKIFGQTNSAISAVKLAEDLHQEMNKTTVYRILERLEDEGTLHSFIGKDGLKWYANNEKDSAPYHSFAHPHFQCKSCGKTECLTMDIDIPPVPKYKIDSIKLLFIGECDDCAS